MIQRRSVTHDAIRLVVLQVCRSYNSCQTVLRNITVVPQLKLVAAILL